MSPVGAHQAGSLNASCFRRPGRSHEQTVMDGGHEYANKANLAVAFKAGLGALELRFMRERNAQNRWSIGILVPATGIATAVSHRP